MLDYLTGVPGLGRNSVPKLLDLLNDLRLKSQPLGPSARPLLALHLIGGAVVEGWLVDFGPGEKGDKEPVVVLHRALPNAQQPAEAVLYVALREIQAVTVFEAPAAGRHLMPPISKMDLRRQADEIAQDISKQTGKTVSSQSAIESFPEPSYGALYDHLQTLKAVVSELLSDNAGREAFKEQVSALSFKPGPDVSARVEGSSLNLTFPTNKAVSAKDLKKNIEDVL